VSEAQEKPGKQANFRRSFHWRKSTSKLHTFAQEDWVGYMGLEINSNRGRDVGIYPELKSPACSRSQGKVSDTAVLQVC